jgi:hypothetical protein
MIAMEMSGKDRNIRGICPELHFFGFFTARYLRFGLQKENETADKSV